MPRGTKAKKARTEGGRPRPAFCAGRAFVLFRWQQSQRPRWWDWTEIALADDVASHCKQRKYRESWASAFLRHPSQAATSFELGGCVAMPLRLAAFACTAAAAAAAAAAGPTSTHAAGAADAHAIRRFRFSERALRQYGIDPEAFRSAADGMPQAVVHAAWQLVHVGSVHIAGSHQLPIPNSNPQQTFAQQLATLLESLDGACMLHQVVACWAASQEIVLWPGCLAARPLTAYYPRPSPSVVAVEWRDCGAVPMPETLQPEVRII